MDVERAELDVLRGVSAHHWPLIRQVVMEVHAEHLEAVLDILRGPGAFTDVAVQQDEELTGSAIYLVYCRRNQEL